MSGTNRRPGWRADLSRAGALLLVCGGAVGCTAYATYKVPPPVDCAADNAYAYMYIDTFEGEAANGPPFFATADDTPGAVMSVTAATPPDGPRCGSMTAMQIQASGDDDWGSLTGYNNFGPRDASAYQGVAFWARVYGNSNKAFTLLLDDPNTYNPNMTPSPPTFNCVPVPTPDGGATGMSGVITDPATGMVVSSGATTAPPPPDGCGNSFQAVVEVTSAWQLYTIPFGAYQQLKEPNKVPNPDLPTTGTAIGTPMITSSLKTFTLRLPKAIETDLWIDNLGFYRQKPPGGDGGVDGP